MTLLTVDRVDAACEVLKRAAWMVEPGRTDGCLNVQLARRSDSAEVVVLLVRSGVSAYEVRLERDKPTLEELFLQLTDTVAHDRLGA